MLIDKKNTIDANVTPRLYWVDMAKGILIILVAMHHMTMRGDELGIWCPAIDIFILIVSAFFYYMPAFFIMSGFFARYDANFKDFVKKKRPCFASSVNNIQFIRWYTKRDFL